MLRDFDTTIDVQRLLDPGESICICSVKCERCCESIVNICISYIVNQNKKQNKKQKQKQNNTHAQRRYTTYNCYKKQKQISFLFLSTKIDIASLDDRVFDRARRPLADECRCDKFFECSISFQISICFICFICLFY